MDLFAFFKWCEESALGTAVRESTWAFPVIEAAHLVAFAVLGGAILIVDLRLAGLGLRRQSVAALARETQPWVLRSLGVMFPTGVLLFLSEATKCYYSVPFWVKMSSLALALLFTFTVRQRAVNADPATLGRWSTAVAATSFALWAGVAWGGRWIGFSG